MCCREPNSFWKQHRVRVMCLPSRVGPQALNARCSEDAETTRWEQSHHGDVCLNQGCSEFVAYQGVVNHKVHTVN